MDISIVIVTLNRPKELFDCLLDIKQQSNKSFEVVVIDQGNSRAIEEYINKNHPNFKYYAFPGRNISKARNFGIKNSTGKYVAFIDDDNKVPDNWIRILIDLLTNKDYPLITGPSINISTGKEVVEFFNGVVSVYGYIINIMPYGFSPYDKEYRGWITRPVGNNMIVRRDVLLEIGGFDEFYEYIHDETDLAIRAFNKGYMTYFDKDLIVYHKAARSINRKGGYKLNWYAEAKNNAYFGIKNSVDFIFLRLLKVFKRIFWVQGPFSALFKLFIQGKIGVLDFTNGEVSVVIGVLVGLISGLFSSRNTI